MKVGDTVEHELYGRGTIEEFHAHDIAVINFASGRKNMNVKIAPMKFVAGANGKEKEMAAEKKCGCGRDASHSGRCAFRRTHEEKASAPRKARASRNGDADVYTFEQSLRLSIKKAKQQIEALELYIQATEDVLGVER